MNKTVDKVIKLLSDLPDDEIKSIIFAVDTKSSGIRILNRGDISELGYLLSLATTAVDRL